MLNATLPGRKELLMRVEYGKAIILKNKVRCLYSTNGSEFVEYIMSVRYSPLLHNNYYELLLLSRFLHLTYAIRKIKSFLQPKFSGLSIVAGKKI